VPVTDTHSGATARRDRARPSTPNSPVREGTEEP
jgi:hypothetical protein